MSRLVRLWLAWKRERDKTCRPVVARSSRRTKLTGWSDRRKETKWTPYLCQWHKVLHACVVINNRKHWDMNNEFAVPRKKSSNWSIVVWTENGRIECVCVKENTYIRIIQRFHGNHKGLIQPHFALCHFGESEWIQYNLLVYFWEDLHSTYSTPITRNWR